MGIFHCFECIRWFNSDFIYLKDGEIMGDWGDWGDWGDIEDRVHKAYEREQSKRWEWDDEDIEADERAEAEHWENEIDRVMENKDGES